MITNIADWRIFEKKQKNAGVDIVIVDVQEPFHKYFGDLYVEELEKYCEDFKRVFQIWDDTNSDKFDYTFPNQVAAFAKTYGGELLPEDVELYFPETMWETVKYKLENIPNEGDMFDTMYGSTWVYIGGQHKWFLCSKQLMELFKSFKIMQRKVILVGGADNECLTDIFVTMQSVGVSVTTQPKFIYSFHGSEFQ